MSLNELKALEVLWLPKLMSSASLFLFFIIASWIAQFCIKRLAGGAENGRFYVFSLLAQVAKYSLLTVGGVCALGTLGVDVSAIIAGLGLTGFALGFALKDTLSNLLAGVMILFFRPFRHQDHIIVDGHEGVVVSIDLRYTSLKGDSHQILIPNSRMLNTVVKVSHKV